MFCDRITPPLWSLPTQIKISLGTQYDLKALSMYAHTHSGYLSFKKNFIVRVIITSEMKHFKAKIGNPTSNKMKVVILYGEIYNHLIPIR